MEKVVIFGSTGMTGTCAVKAAVEKGLNVRAFVRDPSRLPDDLRDRVEVVKGDVLNAQDVSNAVRGVTAVVVVLGTRNDLQATTVLSEGTKLIIDAMNTHKVRIISVCMSAFLFRSENEVPERFRPLNADHQREFDYVKNSGLDYVAVLPPHIADNTINGEYVVKCDGSPGRQVNKHDLGRFLIDCLTQPNYYGTVCGICSK